MRAISVALGLIVAGQTPMDMYLSNNQNRANSFDPPPVLIAADTEPARARARQTVMLAGLRAVESDGIAAACARVREQAAASALWIEIDGGATPSLEALLADVASEVSNGRCAAVVAAPAALLDHLAAYAFDTGIDLVVDASDDQRIAALAIAVSGASHPARVADASGDKNAARLRQLSDEVGRIAATLARLSTGPSSTPPPIEPRIARDMPEVSIETVRAIIRARRLRSRFLPGELFADPAWDMLLDLLQAEIGRASCRERV